MKEFDGNWNFDPSKYIVCRRFWKDPLMIMKRREEWAVLNAELRKNNQPEWIETLR
jgi:outer membrane lipopolysaccharide assembly protein LptE/RlpB